MILKNHFATNTLSSTSFCSFLPPHGSKTSSREFKQRTWQRRHHWSFPRCRPAQSSQRSPGCYHSPKKLSVSNISTSQAHTITFIIQMTGNENIEHMLHKMDDSYDSLDDDVLCGTSTTTEEDSEPLDDDLNVLCLFDILVLQAESRSSYWHHKFTFPTGILISYSWWRARCT